MVSWRKYANIKNRGNIENRDFMHRFPNHDPGKNSPEEYILSKQVVAQYKLKSVGQCELIYRYTYF